MSGAVYAVMPDTDERFVARRSSGPRLVALPAEGAPAPAAIGDRDMPKATSSKRYTDAEKAPILEMLKTQSATFVQTATGISSGTLRKWAWDAGLEIPDGRTKKIDWVDPPAKESPAKESPAKESPPKKPVTNGHAKPMAPAESDGPRLTVSGLATYIQKCVAEQLPAIVREELQKALSNIGRKL